MDRSENTPYWNPMGDHPHEMAPLHNNGTPAPPFPDTLHLKWSLKIPQRLVVDLPLWKMNKNDGVKVTWDDDIPYMKWKVIIHSCSSHHQPVHHFPSFSHFHHHQSSIKFHRPPGSTRRARWDRSAKGPAHPSAGLSAWVQPHGSPLVPSCRRGALHLKNQGALDVIWSEKWENLMGKYGMNILKKCWKIMEDIWHRSISIYKWHNVYRWGNWHGEWVNFWLPNQVMAMTGVRHRAARCPDALRLPLLYSWQRPLGGNI